MYLTPPLLLSAPPINLSLPGAAEGGAKKRLVAPTLSVTLSHQDPADLPADVFVALSSSFDETPSIDINLEALETPSDSESGTLPDSLHDLEWEGEKGGWGDLGPSQYFCVAMRTWTHGHQKWVSEFF